MSAANVIPAQRVQVVQTRVPTVVAHEACLGEPRITIIKEGDTVRAIEVVCLCGEVIRLDCVY